MLTNPQTNIIIMRINIFVVINQINKDKIKIYNHYIYTLNYHKFYFSIIKKLCFDKYKNDRSIIKWNKVIIKQIKAISTKTGTKTKKNTRKKPKQTLKPETKPKQTSKLEPEPEAELKIKVKKKKFKKLRKDFDELRHNFSNRDEIGEYRQAFFDAKKYKLSESKIKKLNESLEFKKFYANIDNWLIIMIIITILSMIMNIGKLGVLQHYLKRLIDIITN